MSAVGVSADSRPERAQLAPICQTSCRQVSPQATEGACTAEEDVYYCGGDACDICDYAF